MWYVNSGSQNSVVRIRTFFRVDSLGGEVFSMPIQSTPRAHPSSCTTGMGLFWENGRAMVLTIRSLLALSLWMGWSCTSASICACMGMSLGDLYLYLYIKCNSCTICVFVNVPPLKLHLLVCSCSSVNTVKLKSWRPSLPDCNVVPDPPHTLTQPMKTFWV